MYSNDYSENKYDSSIPSDLIPKSSLFQRAALLNMKNKISIDTNQEVSEILGIGDFTNAKLGQNQDYLYEVEQRDYEVAPPPPSF